MPEKYSLYRPRYKNISVDDMISFIKVMDTCFSDIEVEGNNVRFKGNELQQLAFDAFNEICNMRFDYPESEVGKLPLQNITIEV